MSDTRKDLPPVSAANFLARVREVLQVYLGSQGSELDRGLTVRDIVGTGLAALNPNGGGDTLLVPSVPTGGTGGGSSEVYEPDLTIPPASSSFTAVAGLTSILVETEPPIYSAGHGHGVARLFGVTRLSGDPLPTFASAVELGQFQGDVFSYATGPGKIWHLWLIWRSKDGVDSAPAGGTNGVSVTTGKIGNADVSDLAIEASKLAEGAIDLTSNKVKASSSFGALAVGYTVTQYLVSTSGVMGNLVVDNAQISGLSAAKLTVGDGTIGGNLKSTNYVEGSDGWIIRPNGTAEFGFAHIRGALQASQVAANFITASMIDARGLSIKDASGNVILSAGSAIDWTKLGGASSNLSGLGYTGALDATRNVYRGAWVAATAYKVGDVTTNAGSSWSARVDHTSSNGTNNPPTLPTTSNTWWELSAAKGDIGSTGPASISAVLSNEAHVFPAAADGTVSSYTGSGTEIRVYEGATELAYDGVGTANGTWKVTSAVVNITAGALTDSGTYLTVGQHLGVAAGTDASSITYTITGKTASGTGFTITKAQTFGKSKQGAVGANATSYWLQTSAPAVQKSIAAIYTPASVTYTLMSATGAGSPAVYAGRFIIATSTDGTTYTDQYTSAANESAKAYTVPAGIKTIRVRGYLAGGTTTLVDELITTIVSDGATGSTGAASLSVVMSNEAHVLPAASDGAVSSYTGSGTELRVYEGATELAYDGVGTANGTWKVTTTPTNITPGTLTDSGTYLTVGQHAGVAAGTDTSSITYTITGKTASGTGFTLTKTQTFTKSKQGAGGSTGLTGPAGPSVLVTASRATTFTATDGTLDGSQVDITFTAAVSGISSPTYVWSFSGFQTAPTNSGTSTQTVTSAQFGTAKAATVTCTVSGTYVDVTTIVRLERNTADAAKANGALQKAGDTITGRINMSVADGLFAGTDTNNGIYLGSSGLVGKKAGATTFAVDTAGDATFGGTLNVASAASGARMEIKNSVIKVFDSGGVLRVQIGDLSV